MLSSASSTGVQDALLGAVPSTARRCHRRTSSPRHSSKRCAFQQWAEQTSLCVQQGSLGGTRLHYRPAPGGGTSQCASMRPQATLTPPTQLRVMHGAFVPSRHFRHQPRSCVTEITFPDHSSKSPGQSAYRSRRFRTQSIAS